LPAPFIYPSEKVSVEYQTYNYDSFTNTKTKDSPTLTNFNYKEFETKLRWTDDNNKSYKPFETLERVGVKIKGKEDAFYKQKHYRLKKGFSFGVWVDIDLNELSLKNNLIVPFGGDQGLSKITFHKNIPSVFKEKQESTTTILLVNDAFVEAGFFNEVDYGITEFADFRYIKSKTSNYYSIKNTDDKTVKVTKVAK